jgi:hypothetical protein
MTKLTIDDCYYTRSKRNEQCLTVYRSDTKRCIAVIIASRLVVMWNGDPFSYLGCEPVHNGRDVIKNLDKKTMNLINKRLNLMDL